MVGNEFNIPVLKELGFRTFENYLSNPDYYTTLSSTRNFDTALTAIVDNTVAFKQLLDTADDDLKARIIEDVDHNYDLFQSIMIDYVASFLEKTKLDNTAIKAIIEKHSCPWCR